MAWDYYRELSTSIGDYHANVPNDLWTAIKAKLDAGTYNGSGSVNGISLYNITVCNYPFQLVQVNEEKNCTMGSGSLKLANYYYYAGDNKAQYTLSNSATMGFTGGGNSNNASSVIFAYNDSTHQACLVRLMTSYYSAPANKIEYQIADNTQSHRETLYANLQGAIPVLYTWQSVPSISGKNGILQSLVQIKEEAINDGEPVSEATVLSFDSLGNINIPSVIDEQMPVDPSDVTSVTATYLIPALENGTYEGIKLLVKKDSIPTSEQDADKVVNLDEPTSILRIDSKSVGNLDEDSHYYFVVKLVDEVGTEATSDPKDIWTSHSEGWTFDYTGEIQTFVAPKTGIYQLETWGAQGGNATDGTNVARGGYGAYAYGEVLLQQGDTLFVNVGGQNGYGGGGLAINPDPDYESLYSKISEWYIIHTPNWSIVVPDVWVAPTQNDYTGGYFVWDSSIRKAHSYYRANEQPDQWYIITTNQDVYALNSIITININKNSNDKYEVVLPTLTWTNEVFIRSYYYPGNKYYGWRMDYNGSTIRANGWYAENPPSVSTPSPFNTLHDALYWVVAKFKNFNLYVDGVAWVIVG